MSIQRNVQQQNAVAFEAMLATATYFRANGVAVGISNFLAAQGIEFHKAAIIFARSESHMLGFDFGLQGRLVTVENRFFDFELELNSTLTEVVSVHAFVDVTAEQDLGTKNRGTGQGQGALAIAVLRTLNSAAETESADITLQGR